MRARKALGEASYFGRVGAGGGGRLVGWRVQRGLGVVSGTDRAGCLLREQHEPSVEVRPPREKPAEVFLAEPSQG